MRASTLSYIMCVIDLLLAVLFAMAHNLPFLIFAFLLAMYNWYVAEWKRGLENETSKDGDSTDSDGSSGDDETEE